jgi:putative membrane protein
MKRLGLLSIALVTSVTVACNSNGRNANNTASNNANPSATVGTSGEANGPDISRGERNFVSDMLADGTREVDLAKLAQQKASSPQVKRFAQMMIEDHTKAGNQLKQIAANYNIQPDTSKDSDKTQDLMNKLSKLQGPDFDREYIDAMVDDHSDAVDALESRTKENKSGTVGTTGTSRSEARDTNVQPESADNSVDASLNRWAADTLPTVRHHLDDAKQIQASLSNSRRNQTASKAAPKINDTKSADCNKAKY